MKRNIMKYDVIFEEQPDGGYTVIAPSLPGCISEGDTFEKAKKNISDAIKLYVEDLGAEGQEVPKRNTNIFMGQVAVTGPLFH